MTRRDLPLPHRANAAPADGLRALLMRRRTTRSFGPAPLALTDLALVVWAAQGRTDDGHRTAPSAHALHPLALTVIAGAVDGLATGVHRYDARRHALSPVADGDHRERVAATTLADVDWLRSAPVLLLLSADVAAVNRHFAEQRPYGERGRRYLWMEAGHASQNIYLQAAESGLGAALVAGFDDERLQGLTPAVLPPGQEPLALLGLGRPAEPR